MGRRKVKGVESWAVNISALRPATLISTKKAFSALRPCDYLRRITGKADARLYTLMA
jgi:hypothetical protein